MASMDFFVTSVLKAKCCWYPPSLPPAVHQAVCLEELTAQELLMKLLDKLAWLDVGHVVSFVRLTSTGLLVRIDDTVVYGMMHEDSFLLQTIKGWSDLSLAGLDGLCWHDQNLVAKRIRNHARIMGYCSIGRKSGPACFVLYEQPAHSDDDSQPFTAF